MSSEAAGPAPKKARKGGGSDKSKKGGKKKGRAAPFSRSRMVNRMKEDHGHPIYSVQFNFTDLRHRDMFATVGSNRATIYRLLPDEHVQTVQCYVDINESENLYTCTWSMDTATGSPLLCVAGAHGIIKIIDCARRCVVRSLVGHPEAVNELRTHPRNPCILLSVSKDQSVRMWNVQTGHMIAVFAGENGHRDEVLSGDFHLSGDRIVSSGMDHTIKIWAIDDAIKARIEQSFSWESKGRKSALAKMDPADHPPSSNNVLGKAFPTVFVQFPVFSTSKVHNNYIDAVRFWGDYVLSKSTEEKVVLWTTRDDRNRENVVASVGSRSSVIVLREYVFDKCEIWYIRFNMDYHQNLLGIGNKKGDVFVWQADTMDKTRPKRLAHGPCNRAIRQVAFNFDGSTLIAVSDNATIWRWDDEKS